MTRFPRRRRADYDFEVELCVRDYECDLQGVVNNAVYQNYLEHARHRYLRHHGFDFVRLHERGCDLVLTRAEIDYLSPLRPGDRFVIASTAARESRLRFGFEQEIFRLPDDKRCVRARVVGTGLVEGRPTLPDDLLPLLGAA